MDTSSLRFAGKRALVTGGGSGIGRATALALAAEGARVAVADRTAEAAAETTAAAPEGSALALGGDVADAAGVDTMLADAVAWLGGLDMLVNSAGVGGVGDPAPLAELPLEAWRTTIETNLTGTFLVMRAALPHLVASGGGAIVNLASTYAWVAGPKLGAYSASKGGIVQLTRNVAVDYASAGIRANAIAPGFVDTPMLRADIAKEDDPAAAIEAIIEHIPQRTLMTAEQVARVILFLLSDDAAVVTGTLLFADGGYTAL
jgi:NAD(P)-dependent dehydrogenase (short-subunit alcohol dehydrogenase family)